MSPSHLVTVFCIHSHLLKNIQFFEVVYGNLFISDKNKVMLIPITEMVMTIQYSKYDHYLLRKNFVLSIKSRLQACPVYQL
jgi:hypothetical protein